MVGQIELDRLAGRTLLNVPLIQLGGKSRAVAVEVLPYPRFVADERVVAELGQGPEVERVLGELEGKVAAASVGCRTSARTA